MSDDELRARTERNMERFNIPKGMDEAASIAAYRAFESHITADEMKHIFLSALEGLKAQAEHVEAENNGLLMARDSWKADAERLAAELDRCKAMLALADKQVGLLNQELDEFRATTRMFVRQQERYGPSAEQ